MNRTISVNLACIGILFLIALCCISCDCKETVNESLEIFIKNRTDSLIHVRLYPKGKPTLTFYPMCEGCGGHLTTGFDLRQNNERVLFKSGDLNIEPYALAAKSFDSIHIVLKNNVILKFTIETVTGYSENIFTENSTWDFRIEEGKRPTQLCGNPFRDYRYSFIISEDKVLIE